MPHPSLHHPARVVVVEDDIRTLNNLCAAINAEDDFVLAASFSRAQPALAWLDTNPVDVLLTDLGLPDGSGIDVIRRCTATQKACDILVITMFGDEKNVLSSIEAGAAGYILKDADHVDVGRAMRDLRAGGSPMSPLIARKVLTRALQNETPADPPSATAASNKVTLTKRETDTLNLIARGYTYDEAAQLLSVSLSTIQTHVKGIYGKLAVNSRSEAVFEAHKMGLLNANVFNK